MLMYTFLYWHAFSFLLNTVYEMELLCHIIDNVLSLGLIIFQNGSSSLCSQLRVLPFVSLQLSFALKCLHNYEVISLGFSLIFPDGLPSYTEHILMCLLVTCVPSLANVCLNPSLIFKWAACFCINQLQKSFTYLYISSSSDMTHKYCLLFQVILFSLSWQDYSQGKKGRIYIKINKMLSFGRCIKFCLSLLMNKFLCIV